ADFPNHCTGGRSAGARRSPADESFDTGRERGLHHAQQVAARPSEESAREHLAENPRRRWRGSQRQGRSAQGLATAAEPRDRFQNVGPDESAYMNMGESSMGRGRRGSMADNSIPAIREHLRGAALEALSFSQKQAAR